MEKDTLAWLQEWYRSQCDGEWEHEKGIRIDSWTIPAGRSWRTSVRSRSLHLFRNTGVKTIGCGAK
jgi:hypothetical protein